MTASIRTRLLAFVAAGLLSLNAQAEDFLVMNLDDSGPGSLRQAILDANENPGPHTIGFEGSLSGQIDLGDHLSIHEEVTITGFPEDPSRITIDGGGEDRIFTLACDGDTVTIEGLTLTHGRTRAGNRFGGAIHSEVCNLVLREMVITNNVANGSPRDGPQEGYGGGVSVAAATLHVFDSTISGNVAGVDSDSVEQSLGVGGGIAAIESHVEIAGSVISDNAAINVNSFAISGRGGGGLGLLASSAVIHRSTISGNMVGNRADAADGVVEATGGGVFANTCADCPGELRIEDSTISGNFAGNSGTSGFLFAGGGGVFAGNAQVVNSTVSGNRVGDLTGTNGGYFAGGGLLLAPRDFETSSTVASSTITDNQALGAQAEGGGIAGFETLVQLHNTIVAGNSAAIGPDGFGDFDSAYSIIENQMDVDFFSGSATAGSPDLGPLADNGGPTETHAIGNLSSAFNAGDPFSCPETDQRGVERPQLGGCDIGAFELAAGSDLTEAFDGLVEAGELTGTGPGKSAANRLNAMRNKMTAIDALFAEGDVDGACEELSSALLKTDGQSPPPDLVQGPGAAALAAAIEEAQEACL